MKKTEKKKKFKKNLRLKGFGIRYYTGETIDNIPFGKGVSETYQTNKEIRKMHKIAGIMGYMQYSKNFMIKKFGYNLLEKYIGEWKNGLWDGKGHEIEYHLPEFYLNKNNTPKIFEQHIGNFKKGKKSGKFKSFYDYSGWCISYYRSDKIIKKSKKNE